MTQFVAARMSSHWECWNQREERPKAADKSAASESACWENWGARRASSQRENKGRAWAPNGVERRSREPSLMVQQLAYVNAGGPGEARRELVWSIAKAHVSAGALIKTNDPAVWAQLQTVLTHHTVWEEEHQEPPPP